MQPVQPTPTGYRLGKLEASGLPPRQAQALLLIANDRTVKQAAREMACSPETVKTHLGEVHKKLNTSRSIALIMAAMEANMLRFCCLLLVLFTGFQPPAATADYLRLRCRPVYRTYRTRTRELWWDDFNNELFTVEYAPCRHQPN